MIVQEEKLRQKIRECVYSSYLNEGWFEYVKDFFDPHGVFSGAGAGIDEDEIRSMATPDAWKLFKAMGGLGTNEKAIAGVFAKRRSAPGGLIKLDHEFDALLQNLKKQRGSTRTMIIKGVLGAAMGAPVFAKQKDGGYKLDIAKALTAPGVSKRIAKTAMAAAKPIVVNKIQDKVFTGAKKSKNDRVGGLQKWLRDDGEQEFADEVKMAYQAEDEKNQVELSNNVDNRQNSEKDEKMNKKEMKEAQIRKIIREELIREMAGAQDLSVPVPIDDLQFVDDGYGSMMMPGVGFSYSVREQDFEAEKLKIKARYGDDVMISVPNPSYPKSRKLHSAKFDSAQSRENQNFMRNQRMMRDRLGREPGLGT